MCSPSYLCWVDKATDLGASKEKQTLFEKTWYCPRLSLLKKWSASKQTLALFQEPETCPLSVYRLWPDHQIVRNWFNSRCPLLPTFIAAIGSLRRRSVPTLVSLEESIMWKFASLLCLLLRWQVDKSDKSDISGNQENLEGIFYDSWS